MCNRREREGGGYVPGAAFYATNLEVDTLRLSYSMLMVETAKLAVLCLSTALKKFKADLD